MDSVLYSTADNPVPENRTEGFFESFDGRKLRYAVFRCEQPIARGTVVLLQGRNEFMEKYFETIRDLTAKGLWVCNLRSARSGWIGAVAEGSVARPCPPVF